MKENGSEEKTTKEPKFYILLFVLAVLIPVIGPLVAIFHADKFRKPTKPILLKITGYLTLIAGLTGIYFISPLIPGLAQKESIRETELKGNLQYIASKINDYIYDHQAAPLDATDLIDFGYLEEFPPNPWTGEPMIPVNFNSDNNAGNFTYIGSKLTGVEGDNWIMVSYVTPWYYLIGYGKKSPGEDIDLDGFPDHVICVEHFNLASGAGVDDIPQLVDVL